MPTEIPPHPADARGGPEASTSLVVLRVECQGYGFPCPAHAWWYVSTARPDAPRKRKRCPLCAARRRWLEPWHRVTCVDCGATLRALSRTGRPRKRCERCSPPRRKAS